MKNTFIKLYLVLTSQFGINPRLMLRSLKSIPHYVRDFRHFRANYTGRINFKPCLNDWFEEGGATRNEYFGQDLLVAKKVFNHNPERHVDIGSRVDGFVAHVACFREIEVFDVRPISTQIPGVIFKQANLMKPLRRMEGYCDSLSSLHALEHFGLGRYGDPVDPDGFKRGLENMACLLKKEGVFYLSVPIGIDRVEFNANRVFDPRVIVRTAAQNSLKLTGLSVIRQDSTVETLELENLQLSNLASQHYTLGIFTFVKNT